MTTAQVVFSVALGSITLLITAFAIYVISSTVWANRWVRRSDGGRPGGRRGR
ncbi:MAG: hypothetical protein M3P34_02800 [Actinomycetota bacterium]|nr:hypothetical protein [Actinomycetota bacterium]